MRVRSHPLPARWLVTERKLIQYPIGQQDRLALLGRPCLCIPFLLPRPAKHPFPRLIHSLPEGILLLLDHELEDIRRALGVHPDLFPCRRVEDREAGVDVPFVAVDAEGDVDFDDFDAADVSFGFPGIVLAVFPRCSHTTITW